MNDKKVNVMYLYKNHSIIRHLGRGGGKTKKAIKNGIGRRVCGKKGDIPHINYFMYFFL